MSEFSTGGKQGPEAFGIPVRPVVRALVGADQLAGLVKDRENRYMHILPVGVNRDLLKAVAEVGPLLEDVQHDRPVPPEAVRPHAGALLDHVLTNGFVIDKVASTDERAAEQLDRVAGKKHWPIVRFIATQKIEEQFPQHARRVLRSDEIKQKVADGLAKAAPFVEAVAGFDNPKEQFVDELSMVADGIRWNATERRNQRVAAIEAEQPTRLRARVSRWMRKRRNRKVTTEDVAYGIEQTRQEILEDDPATPTPMLRAIIDTALAETGRTREDLSLPTLRKRVFGREVAIEPRQYLDATAPEILKALDKPLRESGQNNPRFLKRLKSSRLRKLSRLRPIAARRDVRFWGSRSLTHIRDALPTSGQQLRHAQDQAKEFFRLDAA